MPPDATKESRYATPREPSRLEAAGKRRAIHFEYAIRHLKRRAPMRSQQPIGRLGAREPRSSLRFTRRRMKHAHARGLRYVTAFMLGQLSASKQYYNESQPDDDATIDVNTASFAHARATPYFSHDYASMTSL